MNHSVGDMPTEWAGQFTQKQTTMTTDKIYYRRVANTIKHARLAISMAWQWQNLAAYYDDDDRRRELKKCTSELNRARRMLRNAREKLGGYFQTQFTEREKELEKLSEMRREIAQDIRKNVDDEIVCTKCANFIEYGYHLQDRIYDIEYKVRDGILETY